MDEILDHRRHLDIKSAYNVRDLGGYRTRDGGCTRWRRFLRADSLHRLTPADQAALVDYGVGTMIDLRWPAETQAHTNVFAGSDKLEFHHLSMLGDGPSGGDPAPKNADTAQIMAHGYCGCLDKYHIDIGRILQTLAAAKDHVALYHCASGKDRTGLVSAMLLDLAGVPRETIAADYALTARYMVTAHLAAANADSIRTWEDYQNAHCPPDTMPLVLDHLGRTYGGVSGYMQAVGLTPEQIAQLRDSFLE